MIDIKEHFYQDIQGWTTFEPLYKAVVNNFSDGSHFVEVGAWRGKSAAFMGIEIANSGKQIKFDIIDTFDGSEEHLDPTSAWYVKELVEDKDYLYNECKKNLEPVSEWVNIIRGRSVETADLYKNKTLDFVFIDGSHKKQDVYEDIEAWFPKMKEGGYIAGHDISHWEVREAVEEYSKHNGLSFYSDMSMDIWFHKVGELREKLPYSIAYSSRETLDFSYNIVKELNNLEGDIVECGVAAGAQVIAFKLALNEIGSRKRIFCFDSFCGIPYAGPNDTEQPGIGKIEHDVNIPESARLKTTGITSHSQEEVKQNFQLFGADTNEVYFCEGWFQNTLPLYSRMIERISILRLDGDLYESTFVALEHLYPKVVEGGYIIVDDWALEGCRKACLDYLGSEPEVYQVSGGVHYFIKK